MHLVEREVRDLIERVSLTTQEREAAEERLLAEGEAGLHDADTESAKIQEREQKLRGEQERAHRAYYVDVISTGMLKREQDRIRRELLDIARQLTLYAQQTRHLALQIAEALDQLENVDHRFDASTADERRALCWTLFEKIEV